MNVNEAIAGLQIVGRQMIEDDLVWGNAGNISMRIGPERFLITASGSSLGSL
ncbi:MAG TPA: class II aldolase family protein, partial [Firmicutes bacterium]|nr:class II aldolase family protein [Bacillota bacterium]